LPFAVLIQGHQGSGKNTVLEQIAKIIGEQHYNTSANLNDITGGHAEGMMNKLLVNLNEINFKDSKGKGDLLKSLISENRMTFDVKFVRPITQIIYAMIVATTNRNCSIELDISSGERRWFIFVSNLMNRKLCEVIRKKTGKNGWDFVHKEWDKPEFTQQLYLYLMTLPIEDFNFQQAQTEMTNTPAYNKLASYFVPVMALMMQDYIMLGGYKNNADEAVMAFDIDSDSDDDEIPEHYVVNEKKAEKKKKYYEEDSFYEPVKIKSKIIHKWYEQWYETFGGNEAYKSNAKKFQNSIMALPTKSINKLMMSGNNVGFEFIPARVIGDLHGERVISVDMSQWRVETKNEEADDWGFSSDEGEDIN
jgi:hypothetical protein